MRHAIEIRLRQSFALLPAEFQDGLVLADVLAELLRQLDEALGDGLEAVTLLRRKGHAAVLERFEQILLELLLGVGVRHHAPHALVELLVLKELGHEDRLFDQRSVAGVAHLGVRMDAVEQRDRAMHILDHHGHLVPGIEHRFGRDLLQRQPLDLGHPAPRLGKGTLRGRHQRAGVIDRNSRAGAEGDCFGHRKGAGILAEPKPPLRKLRTRVLCIARSP